MESLLDSGKEIWDKIKTFFLSFEVSLLSINVNMFALYAKTHH